MSLSSSTVEPGGEDQTDSGTDSPTSHKFDGYAVPLYVLAQYMRDGTWLDIRTEDGPAHRVRIIEIVVRVRGEDIRFRQEWLEEVGEDDMRRCRHVIDVDSESIWKIEPSRYEIDEVQPYKLQIEWVPGPRQTPEQMQHVLATVLLESVRMHNLTIEELRHTTDRANLAARYATMIVTYEMSDLSAHQIAEALGYRSPTPVLSAMSEIRLNRASWRDKVVRLGARCDAAMGFKARRSAAFPRNYSPVLPTPPPPLTKGDSITTTMTATFT